MRQCSRPETRNSTQSPSPPQNSAMRCCASNGSAGRPAGVPRASAEAEAGLELLEAPVDEAIAWGGEARASHPFDPGDRPRKK